MLMRIPKGNHKLDRKDSLYRIEKAKEELTENNILGLSLLNKQFENWVNFHHNRRSKYFQISLPENNV